MSDADSTPLNDKLTRGRHADAENHRGSGRGFPHFLWYTAAASATVTVLLRRPSTGITRYTIAAVVAPGFGRPHSAIADVDLPPGQFRSFPALIGNGGVELQRAI